jgi:hypothetical protein
MACGWTGPTSRSLPTRASRGWSRWTFRARTRRPRGGGIGPTRRRPPPLCPNLLVERPPHRPPSPPSLFDRCLTACLQATIATARQEPVRPGVRIGGATRDGREKDVKRDAAAIGGQWRPVRPDRQNRPPIAVKSTSISSGSFYAVIAPLNPPPLRGGGFATPQSHARACRADGSPRSACADSNSTRKSRAAVMRGSRRSPALTNIMRSRHPT